MALHTGNSSSLFTWKKKTFLVKKNLFFSFCSPLPLHFLHVRNSVIRLIQIWFDMNSFVNEKNRKFLISGSQRSCNCISNNQKNRRISENRKWKLSLNVAIYFSSFTGRHEMDSNWIHFIFFAYSKPRERNSFCQQNG